MLRFNIFKSFFEKELLAMPLLEDHIKIVTTIQVVISIFSGGYNNTQCIHINIQFISICQEPVRLNKIPNISIFIRNKVNV